MTRKEDGRWKWEGRRIVTWKREVGREGRIGWRQVWRGDAGGQWSKITWRQRQVTRDSEIELKAREWRKGVRTEE